MWHSNWWLAGVLAASAAVAQADDKKIDVQVVNGQIVVPETQAGVKRAQGNIVWELSTSGYSFPANGIVIKLSDGAFSNCKPIGGGTKFQCKKDKHKSGASYKYDVNVNRGTTALPTLDPFINLE